VKSETEEKGLEEYVVQKHGITMTNEDGMEILGHQVKMSRRIKERKQTQR